MGRKKGGQIDEKTIRVIAACEFMRGVRGWTYADLGDKMDMSRSNVTRRFHPAKGRYGSWTLEFTTKVATAFGMTCDQLLGKSLGTASAEISTDTHEAVGVWDPSSEKAIEVIRRFTEHESHSGDGIGFFRIPPGPITPLDLSHRIYQNLFGHLDTFGDRIINSYADITLAYTEEYERCGGHYGDWTNTTMFFEGEIRRLIRGEGEYAGCERWASAWLDELKNRHVKKLGYRLGFVNENKIPPEIKYDLIDADSLIIVGGTLSVRRITGTLQLIFRTSGDQFERDHLYMRRLAHDFADFSESEVIRKLETLQRNADGPRRLATLA